MSGNAVHRTSSPHRLSPRRPGMVRVHHTWHGERPSRSHFEDFMREIGVDAQATHLCCVPRQASRTYVRVRSKSEPAPVAAASVPASSAMADRGRSTYDRVPRRQSFPTTAPRRLPAPPPALPSRAFSDGRRAQLKAQPLTAVDTESHGAAHICTTVTADQALRGALPRRPPPHAPWAALPHRPTLAPTPSAGPPLPPTGALSRVPSFASLATVSSSEGPPTPRAPLAVLETRSRLRVPGVCGACARAGSNFPSCPACGGGWCSRACRVRAPHDACGRKGASEAARGEFMCGESSLPASGCR